VLRGRIQTNSGARCIVAFRRPTKLSRTMLLLAFWAGASVSGFGQVSSTGPSIYDGNAQTPAPAKTTRRRRHRYASATTQQPAGASQTASPDAAQRTRDAQILAAQKAQSAEIARQNSITTGNVVKERAAQQAEPRIQDAPGPGSQPLAGDPAIQPATPAEAPRIQDAPGPAQTLPQPPPAQTAPPAPQETTSPN